MIDRRKLEIREALTHIERNIDRTEMEYSWRPALDSHGDDELIVEHYEFWIMRRKGGETSSDN